jgi:hypothetical protein
VIAVIFPPALADVAAAPIQSADEFGVSVRVHSWNRGRNMRKLYRGCAALAVAAGGLFYGAAEYTFRHPDSLIGRCVVGAYQLTTTFGPLFHTGAVLIAKASASPSAAKAEDELCSIPDDPEPVAISEPEPCPAEQDHAIQAAVVFDPNRGRLPGKIVIDEGEEPPMINEDDPVAGLTSRAIEAIGRRLDGVDSPNPQTEAERAGGNFIPIGLAMHESIAEMPVAIDSRQMPYCEDDEKEDRAMPYAEDIEDAKVERASYETWDLILPKGTEVGGHEESETKSLGNDCREDPSVPLQIPGCPYSCHRDGLVCPHTGKSPADGEEPGKLPPIKKKKKSKPIEPEKLKKSFDDLRGLQKSKCPAVDTMEFRPSDWGRDDVALPPF